MIRHRSGAAAAVAAIFLATTSSSAAWELRVCAETDNPPFSEEGGTGFDTRIAQIVAAALGAELTFVWLPDARARTRMLHIQGGECDMVMGVLEGQPGLLTSHAYYRTGYVFLYPEDAPHEVASLDDPVLRELRIGVPGGPRKLAPPSVALANRGLVGNQVHFAGRGHGRHPAVAEAVAEGAIDVAVVWGPAAGAFAKENAGFVIAPVRPEIDIPFLPMIASLTLGFRQGDEALRDAANRALSRTWNETRAVLAEAGVPTLDLPRPVEELGGG